MNSLDETSQEEERRSEIEAQPLFEQLIDAHELLGPLYVLHWHGWRDTEDANRSAARYEVVDKLERIDESKLGPLLGEQARCMASRRRVYPTRGCRRS
jgi:hypothetical protein